MALSTKELVMKVLQKLLNSSIQDFIYSSTFTAIYEQEEAISMWNPLNMEGSLYITKRLPPLVE